MAEETNKTMKSRVMGAIEKGSVRMRPHWYFVAATVTALVCALALLLALVYVSSLSMFFVWDSGLWFAPSFGARGWFALLHAFPWMLLFAAVVFVFVLEALVRRFAFVYRKPVLTSVVGVVVLIALGAAALSQTHIHKFLSLSARRDELPQFLGVFYGNYVRPPHLSDVYHGRILTIAHNMFTIFDPDGDGTSTIIVTPKTRLPHGSDFSVGEEVLVIGDRVGTDTVQAFGVRDADN